MGIRVTRSFNYKWDDKAGYLRTYPPNMMPEHRTSQPYPEGWLYPSKDVQEVVEGGDQRRYRGDDILAEGIILPWDGKGDSEVDDREARRERILNGRQLNELTERELRQWMRTKAYTRSDNGHMGWGATGKLTRYKTPRRQRVGRTGFCKQN